MKTNEVKFIPKTNAVSAAIAEATGMPIIGELMAFAGLQEDGNENEPEEPSDEQ